MPFSPRTLDFLFENTLQNSKAWFQEHKDEYQKVVLDPLRELIVQLSPFMRSVDDRMITDPKKIVSRIYKDARYSHDGQIFRNHLWFCLHGKRKLILGSRFLFRYFTEWIQLRRGYYLASSTSMEQYRKMIVNRDRMFEKMRGGFFKAVCVCFGR